jgi:hypothetical protein
MKNNTIRIFVCLFALSLAGCATTTSTPPAGMVDEKNITFPVTVEKVWYRTDKVRQFELALAYEDVGTITINETTVEFVSKKGKISIPGKNIERISWEKLSPDVANSWVVVHYTDSGAGNVAAFKGALYSDPAKDGRIFSAIRRIMKPE